MRTDLLWALAALLWRLSSLVGHAWPHGAMTVDRWAVHVEDMAEDDAWAGLP